MSHIPPSAAASLAEHYVHCEAHVRAGDRDFWLAMLFAPAAKRPHLYAVRAFLLEIAQVRERVTEPLAGELRLQWWRDAIEGEARGDIASHPVAAALLDTIQTCRLPREVLTDLIEAHRFDLYDDPMSTLHDWENYCEQTAAGPIQVLAIILTGKQEPGGIGAASHAGVALSVIGQLADLSRHRTPVYLPADLLARHKLKPADIEAGHATKQIEQMLADMRGIARLHLDALRNQASTIEPAALPAYLLTSLVEPTLRLSERKGRDPFTEPLLLPRWKRQWIMWRASRRNAL
ncbi:phytoene/squalene synthase family protein [Lichenihabitans psoromatis]|uniref:phytoene/squalene synthase family protein n=1 Tax=Lichenihabitans psoromatis TaxID=2528642 RepID=UPI0010384505|nr:phytoene/squalene synthase family protein [Lichenihabitans psoromatis]